MTKLEKIQDLLGDVEADIKVSTVRDILADLADFANDGVEDHEVAGMLRAIEIIKANYSH